MATTKKPTKRRPDVVIQILAPKQPTRKAPKRKAAEPPAKKAAREKRLSGIKLLEAKQQKKKERRKKVAVGILKAGIFAFKTAKSADKRTAKGIENFFKF